MRFILVIIPIDDIKIKKRVRRDIGDLDELCQSMRTYGLLNPVTITRKKVLLAGYRRIEAARILGWREIECNMVDAPTSLARLEIEAQENTTRKGFTPEEMEILEERLDYLRSPFFKRFFMMIKRFFRTVFRFLRTIFRRGR